MSTRMLERSLETRLGHHLSSLGITDPNVSATGRVVPAPGQDVPRWVRLRRYSPQAPVRVVLDGPTRPTRNPDPGSSAADACGVSDRVRAALGEAGLEEGMVEVLSQVAQACATVTNPAVLAARAAQEATQRNGSTGATGTAATGTAASDTAASDTAASDTVASGVEGPGEVGAAVARGSVLLASVETLLAATAKLEAVAVAGTTGLTMAVGRVLLADKDVADPQELSATAREKWRGSIKSRTRAELAAATGWGTGQVGDLVSLATAPASVTGPVSRAMAAGEAGWALVRRYHRACADLDTEDAAAIANGLFGNDPDAAVTERLDSAGELTGSPWQHTEFNRVLDREVNKVKNRDPEQVAKAREKAAANADVRLRVDKEGTATLTLSCTPTQGALAADRIERAARAARAAGDPRTLRELRTAFAAALLLHGTLDTTDLPQDPDRITVEQCAELSKILGALPTAQLNVIIPLSTLLGTTGPLTTTTSTSTGTGTGATVPAGQAVDTNGRPVPAAFARPPGTPPPGTPLPGSPGCTCVCTCPASASSGDGQAPPPQAPPRQAPPPDAPPGEDPGDAGPRQDPTPEDESAPDQNPTPDQTPDQEPAGEDGVAEVIGKHSIFLSGQEARTLALTPGSTLYRLVTDPATGALLERSTTAYKFDKAMRAHIIAADVFCRIPGCLRPASRAQIDHVQEYGTQGGHTCISNGQPLHEPHHDLKTKKHWDAVIHANRDVTWTTLLGRIYRTKAHDYTQYTKLLTAATTAIHDATAAGTARADAIDDAIYQALTYRPPGAPYLAPDDDPFNPDIFTAWDILDTTHLNTTGRRTYHPHPDTLNAEKQRHHDTQPDQTDQGDTGEQADSTDRAEHTGQAHKNRADRDTPTTYTTKPTTPWTHDPDAPPPF